METGRLTEEMDPQVVAIINQQEVTRRELESGRLDEFLGGLVWGTFRQKTCCVCICPLYTHLTCGIPCGHVFHRHCIIDWARRNVTCPICRFAWARVSGNTAIPLKVTRK